MKQMTTLILLSLIGFSAKAGLNQFPGIPENPQINANAVIVCDGLTESSWREPYSTKLQYRPFHVEVINERDGLVANIYVAGKRMRDVELVRKNSLPDSVVEDNGFYFVNTRNRDYMTLALSKKVSSRGIVQGSMLTSTLINDGNENAGIVNCKASLSFLGRVLI